MSIKKHEFYEGAAIHQLLRSGDVETLSYFAPFFLVNSTLWLYLKHSTKGRSPWQFTFSASEQELLDTQSRIGTLVLGLVCAADGVAALWYEWYRSVSNVGSSTISISCRRQYNEHYSIVGPKGELARKVPPSMWRQLLNNGVENEPS